MDSDDTKSASQGTDATDLETTSEIEPTFEIDPVQLQFALHNKLRRLCVQANIMFLILDKLIFKINLDNPAIVKRYQFAQDALINECWFSPDGKHFIVQVNGTSYYYLHDSYDKFKVLPRFKGLEIVSIVFPSLSEGVATLTEATGDFLVVTKDNTVSVAHIKSHFGQDNKKDDKYVKPVYKAEVPILGVCFGNNNTRIEVFLLTSVLLYDCFEPSLAEISKLFKLKPQSQKISQHDDYILELSSSSYVLFSPLSNCLVSNDLELSLSKIEKLNPLVKLSGDLVITDHHLLMLTHLKNELVVFSKLSNTPPKIVALDQAVLGITADYVTGTFWLYGKNGIHEILIQNESVKVWYDYYRMGRYEEALLVLEPSTTKEASLKKDMVLIKQGYDYLQKGAFGLNFGDVLDPSLVNLQIKGLRILASTSEPFEKICLMSMNLQNPSSSPINNSIAQMLLIEYLLVKFNHAKAEGSKIRIIVLSSWIIELMLRNIHTLENGLQNNDITLVTKTPKDLKPEQLRVKYLKQANDDFQKFLDSNYKLFDKETVYQIISELNYQQKLTHFAELNNDYEYILNIHIYQEDWQLCLSVLMKMYSANLSQFESSFIKSSSILLLNYPAPTIETWLKFSNVNYEKLLPAVLLYNKKFSSRTPIFENYSITFLQKLIFLKNVRDQKINNYYLLLLITYPTRADDNDSDEKLYINKQILRLLNHIKLDSKLYDSGFILRLCLDNKHIQPAVMILVHDFKLFEQGLKLALDNNLTDLATYVLERFNKYIDKNLEQEAGDDEELDMDVDNQVLSKYTNKLVDISVNKLHHKDFTKGKKLWLLFSKYLIEGVMSGQEFEILNDVEGEVDSKALNLEANGSQSVKDITKEIVNGGTEPIDESFIGLKKANKVLKYLLDFSFNSTLNSSFVNLKDLLHLFPESVMVNNFKDEIIRSLEQYNTKINQLSVEMKESLVISEKLNGQIKEGNDQVKNGKIFTIVEPGEPCAYCNKLLISKNFVVFPNCHHNFHKECIIKYYLVEKGDYRFKKFFQNFKKLNGVGNKKELDDIMLSECLLCNEGNILTLDNNLVDPIKEKEAIEEWDL